MVSAPGRRRGSAAWVGTQCEEYRERNEEEDLRRRRTSAGGAPPPATGPSGGDHRSSKAPHPAITAMDDLDDSNDRDPNPRPPLSGRPWRHPSEVGRGRLVRWGLPDAAVCWLVGMLGGVIAAVPAVMSMPGPRHTLGPAVTFLVVLPAQNVTMLAALWWVSRIKGLGVEG